MLLNQSGHILLREPANHYDGYVWTFAKGKPEPGDTPERAALREVHEETGYRAEIIDVLPGQFQGGTTSNIYFVMRPLGVQGALDWETQSTCWATFAEAELLISQTINVVGRQRDLAVLAAARAWYAQHTAAEREKAEAKAVAQGESFMKAFELASQPNYLGSPEVVTELMASWFGVIIGRLAQTATAQQYHDRMHQLVRIMTEDDTGYTRLPGWHTEAALGKVLITACNLNADYCKGESLALIVSEALAAIDMMVGKLAYQAADTRDGAEQLLQRTDEIFNFVVAVFFGTHEVLFPGKTLASFNPPPRPTEFEMLLAELKAVDQRQGPLQLAALGIAPGTMLSFKPDPSLQAQVVEGNRVEFMGEVMSLSRAALKAFEQIGRTRKAARGPDYWCWEGVALTHWRAEKDI